MVSEQSFVFERDDNGNWSDDCNTYLCTVLCILCMGIGNSIPELLCAIFHLVIFRAEFRCMGHTWCAAKTAAMPMFYTTAKPENDGASPVQCEKTSFYLFHFVSTFCLLALCKSILKYTTLLNKTRQSEKKGSLLFHSLK